MSSSDSQKAENDDSIADEIEEEVLKMNKINRGKHHRLSRHHPEDSLYRQALKEYMFGKFEIASENCKKMIATNPQNPEPYFLMANMHQQAGKKNSNIKQLFKAVQFFFFHAYYSHPSLQKWLKVADLSFQLDMYMQAAYCYGRALKINNTSLQINLKRAECLQKCQQTKKAINIYQKVLEKITNSIEVYKKYAKLRFRRKQYSKARDILLGYQKFAEDLNVKFMICQTYMKQKKYQELEDFIIRYILIEPGNKIEDDSQNSSIESQEQNLNNLQDLPIQFVQMLYVSRLFTHDQIKQKQYLQKQLQITYQENYKYSNLRNYLIQFYQTKYAKFEKITNHYQSFIQQNQPLTQQQQEQILLAKEEYEELPEIYQEILSQIESYCAPEMYSNEKNHFLNVLIKYPAHQTIKNYLAVSEYLASVNKNQQALKTLRKGLLKFKDSVEIKMQISHLKTLWDKNHSIRNKGSKKNLGVNQRFEPANKNQKQDIFYSDQEDINLSESQIKESSHNLLINEKNKHQKTRRLIRKNKKTVQSFSDTVLTEKLLKDTRQTLQTICQKLKSQQNDIDNDSEMMQQEKMQAQEDKNFKSQYCQVKQCIAYLVQVDNISEKRDYNSNIIHDADINWTQRIGIYTTKNHKKRRIVSDKSRIQRKNFIQQNSHIILDCLKHLIFFMKKCIHYGKYQYICTFAQMLSKSKFFAWQNRIPQFFAFKCKIYEFGILACISLQKYKKSLFFCRYLINKNPTDKYYLALLTYVMGALDKNNEKINLNSVINKGIQNLIQEQNQSNGLYLDNSYQFKELVYMLGLQYMDNGFFQLAIKMFLKVLNSLSETNLDIDSHSILITCNLYMCTCFLQIASSRTVFNKLDYVNRSAYCLKNYQTQIKKFIEKNALQEHKSINFYLEIQVLFNMGRWYIYVKIYKKALEYFKSLIEKIDNIKRSKGSVDQKIQEYQKKAVYNLIIIYKDCQQYEEADKLSIHYFSVS